jgi:hypothetical protein
MDKYYTIQEVAEITRFSKQTIYNRLSQKKFQQGIHYLKPSPKKILFLETGIQFLLGKTGNVSEPESKEQSTDSFHENQISDENYLVTKEFSKTQTKQNSISAFNI